MKSKSEALYTPELLEQYAIEDGESGLDSVLQNSGGKIPTGGLISVKSSRVKPEKEKGSHKSDKKRRTDNHSHKSSTKKKRS